MTIQRYAIDHEGYMVKHSDGPAVLYADHLAAMQREREVREKLVEALARAKEWMDEDGCDCGQDEPGTCALCICNAALAAAEEME